MRTTVNIDDDLLRVVKARIARGGASLDDVINQALRRELLVAETTARPEIPVFHGGTGPATGVDIRSNAALHDLLDDDVPQRRRR